MGCCICGKEATLIQVADPYAEEMTGEIIIDDWCEECYNQGCLDI